ncbi:MAG: LysM domain-containing protein, partial [Chloroflexota bacterium]
MAHTSVFRRWGWLLLVAIIGLSSTVLNAQPTTCPSLVETALERFDGLCTALDRNTACYGNDDVLATYTTDDPTDRLEAPGDIISLTELARLESTPLDVERDLWGLAALKLQTVLPGTLPGQGIVFVLAGDSQVEGARELDTPFEAFYFTGGLGAGNCNEAPDTLYVQGPQTTEVQIRANGVDITIGSTIALNSDEMSMDVTTLAGEATITCPDGEQIIIPAGFTSRNLNTFVVDEGLDNVENDVIVLDCNWTEPRPLSVTQWQSLAGPLQGDQLSFLNYQLPDTPPPALTVALLPSPTPCFIDTSGSPYVVQPNDTLTSIANQFGTTVPELVRINCITNPDVIQVGSTLYLPFLIVPTPIPLTPTPTAIPAPAPASSGSSSSSSGSSAPPPGPSLIITGGNGQTLTLDDTFTGLSVQAIDASGNPLAGDTINYVISGGTAIWTAAPTAITDGAGNATSPTLTPDCPSGAITVVATSTTLGLSQTFNLTSQNTREVTNANNTGLGSLFGALGALCTNVPSTVTFDPANTTYNIAAFPVFTVTLGADVTVDGSGTAVTVQALAGDQHFGIDGTSALTLENLALSGGTSVANGGSINNDGTLTLNTVQITGSSANFGGAIYNTGTLIVNSSTIGLPGLANTATTDGGGIYNTGGGTVTITGSTIQNNTATGGVGGGVRNENGTLTLDNVQVTNNTASLGGGGVYNDTTLIVNNTTVFQGNQATDGVGGNGGGISNAGTMTISNAQFIANNAVVGGGAIKDVTTGGTQNISDTTFTGNTSPLGPMISIGTTTMNLTNITESGHISSHCSFLAGGVFNATGVNSGGDGSC